MIILSELSNINKHLLEMFVNKRRLRRKAKIGNADFAHADFCPHYAHNCVRSSANALPLTIAYFNTFFINLFFYKYFFINNFEQIYIIKK